MMDTVPKAITPQLLEFCRELSQHRPYFVASKPAADAVLSYCFDNVSRKIERAGGSVIYGWAIWSVPDVYYEAEHHGIWRGRQGKLLDVSPQINGARKIFFLPDPEAIFDPLSFRSNVLRPVKGNPVAEEFAELANARAALIDKYRKDGAKIAVMSLPDQLRQKEIERDLARLLPLLGMAS